MDPEAFSGLCEAIKTIAQNGNLDHEIKRARTNFDGSSADTFAKWMTEIDAIHRALKDDSDTIWAAQQLLTGPAIDSAGDLLGTHTTWSEFKAALSEQSAHLNTAAHCKNKLKNTIQQNDENISGFRTRIKNLAQHAYPETLDESNVIEIV